MPPNIKDHSVVVAIAIVIGIRNLAKAGIEPGRSGAVVQHQIAREGIDVDSVGNVPNRVAVGNDIVGVRPVVADAGRKVVADLSFDVADQMTAFGDSNSGLIAPMAKPAPTIPPCASSPPPACGVAPVPGPNVG